jgi:hypothetical protein
MAPVGFKDLPGEVRNNIYEHVIGDLQDQRPNHGEFAGPSFNLLSIDPHPQLINEWQPALTRVDRQIRAEALPLYYARNMFVVPKQGFPDFETRLDLLRAWLRSIGPQNASLVSRIGISLSFQAPLRTTVSERLFIGVQLSGPEQPDTVGVNFNDGNSLAQMDLGSRMQRWLDLHVAPASHATSEDLLDILRGLVSEVKAKHGKYGFASKNSLDQPSFKISIAEWKPPSENPAEEDIVRRSPPGSTGTYDAESD